MFSNSHPHPKILADHRKVKSSRLLLHTRQSVTDSLCDICAISVQNRVTLDSRFRRTQYNVELTSTRYFRMFYVGFL